MVDVVRTIGGDVARDYATIDDWASDLDTGTIYNPGDVAIGEMYDDGDFSVIANILVNGGSTLGLGGIKLRAAPGQAHGGILNGGVRLLVTGGSGYNVLTVQPANINFEIDDLEINCGGRDMLRGFYFAKGTGGNSTSDTARRLIAGNSSGVKVREAIFNINRSLGGAFQFYITNCLTYDFHQLVNNDTRGIYGTGATNRCTRIANCTSWDITSAGTGDIEGIAISEGLSDTGWIKNNISTDSAGTTATDFAAPGLTITNNNVSSDASAPGPGSVINALSSDIHVDPAGGDFSLKPGSPAIGIGEDLGTVRESHIDITGFARPSPGAWDAGAYADQGAPAEVVNMEEAASSTATASAQLAIGVEAADAAIAADQFDSTLVATVNVQAAATAGEVFDANVAYRVNIAGGALAGDVFNVLGAIEGTMPGDATADATASVEIAANVNQLAAAIAQATMSAVTGDTVQAPDSAIAGATASAETAFIVNLADGAVADAVADPVVDAIVNLLEGAVANAASLGGSALEVLMVGQAVADATATGQLATFTVDTPTSRTVIIQGAARTVAIRRAKRTIAIHRGELNS